MEFKTIKCDFCGKEFKRYVKKIRPTFNFCSKKCLADFSNKIKNPKRYNELKDLTIQSKTMSETNRRINPTRMTPETRTKISKQKFGTGKTDCYLKLNGVHVHRTVAEEILGRPLKKGEVVHHIDENKKNNNPSNLMIFNSQSEHAKWHRAHDKGGD